MFVTLSLKLNVHPLKVGLKKLNAHCDESFYAGHITHTAVASPGFGARGAQVEAPRWVESGDGGRAPSPENVFNFYIKMVSSGAFLVAIS